MYNFGIFIGRFQPFHNSHLDVVRQALAECKKLIIVVGSAKSSPSVKNPFTYNERVDMIKSTLTEAELSNVVFVPVRDYFYNENMWITDVQSKVSVITGDDPSIALYGSYKDGSSYYINLFPQWTFRPARHKSILNATDIRNMIFCNSSGGIVASWSDKSVRWHEFLPKSVVHYINTNFIYSAPNSNELYQRYKDLREEYQFIVNYKKKWENAPYPPTFVTTDAVVIQSGHVLLIKRKFALGKGQLALPGGYLNVDERIEDGMLRELKEETRIKVHSDILRSSIVHSKIFDFPGRSLRGRIITHAFHIDLGSGPLPEVRGNDDAAGAFWMPLADAIQNESNFFEDHWHIVYHFSQQERRQK